MIHPAPSPRRRAAAVGAAVAGAIAVLGIASVLVTVPALATAGRSAGFDVSTSDDPTSPADFPPPSTDPTPPVESPDEPALCPIDVEPLPTETAAIVAVSYQMPAPCRIDVTWVPLTSLFKVPKKPAVGDILAYDVDITVAGKMKDLIAAWALAAAGNKPIISVRMTCVVTAIDDGFDAVTVTCRVRTFGVTYRDGNLNAAAVKLFPNNADTPVITAGIAIVK